MRVNLITAPRNDAFDIEEFKFQVNADTGPFQLTRALGFLRGQVEEVEGPECCIQLITATYELRQDGFPACGYIEIPKPPLRSVESITYTDPDGEEQTFGTLDGSPETTVEYGVEYNDVPARGRIFLRSGQSWPSTICEAGSVRVRFTCGFGDKTEDVPENIKNWIYIKAASLYNIREGVQVGNMVTDLKYVDRMLDKFRACKKVF